MVSQVEVCQLRYLKYFCSLCKLNSELRDLCSIKFYSDDILIQVVDKGGYTLCRFSKKCSSLGLIKTKYNSRSHKLAYIPRLVRQIIAKTNTYQYLGVIVTAPHLMSCNSHFSLESVQNIRELLKYIWKRHISASLRFIRLFYIFLIRLMTDSASSYYVVTKHSQTA